MFAIKLKYQKVRKVKVNSLVEEESENPPDWYGRGGKFGRSGQVTGFSFLLLLLLLLLLG